ncbi:hypothetical protein [Kocuria turfanensis]|nr:hypothetical protein [Kocuria turfanensis]
MGDVNVVINNYSGVQPAKPQRPQFDWSGVIVATLGLIAVIIPLMMG